MPKSPSPQKRKAPSVSPAAGKNQLDPRVKALLARACARYTAQKDMWDDKARGNQSGLRVYFNERISKADKQLFAFKTLQRWYAQKEHLQPAALRGNPGAP